MCLAGTYFAFLIRGKQRRNFSEGDTFARYSLNKYRWHRKPEHPLSGYPFARNELVFHSDYPFCTLRYIGIYVLLFV